jgi:hypothetical protein
MSGSTSWRWRGEKGGVRLTVYRDDDGTVWSENPDGLTWHNGKMISRRELQQILEEEGKPGFVVRFDGADAEEGRGEVTPCICIPEALQGCRFILVKARDKPAIEKGWQTTANYAYDDPHLLAHIERGGNYGVMPDGGVCILDADQTDRLMELGVLDRLLETFVVRTGRKDGYGSHFYIRCPDAPAEKFILRDPETRADLGDLRGSGHKSFCVGPGCTHPSGGRYEVVNDAPLLEIPWAELKAVGRRPLHPAGADDHSADDSPGPSGASLSRTRSS